MVENMIDVVAVDFVNDTEKGGDPLQDAAVEVDAFHCPADGLAGGRGGEKQDDVLTLDGHQVIIPEDHLILGIIFRRNDVDRFVQVVIVETTFSEFSCQTGADNFRTIHAYDGIDDRRVR